MNIALILAGGQGSRMGSKLPKQFLDLDGIPVILRSVSAFEHHPEIDAIGIVCGTIWADRLHSLLEQSGFQKICAVIPGGNTRRESSFLGLTELMRRFSAEDIVLIHDAARPLVSARIIHDCITAANQYHACTAVIPSQDTLLESENGCTALAVPDRSRLFAVQTPQAFRLGLIYDAHQQTPASAAVTDDAGLLIAQQTPVYLVDGEKRNLKITSPEDLLLAELYLKNIPDKNKNP